MTDAQAAILEILTAHGRAMFGLEIVKASNGRVERGTVYVHLQRLEDAGWVLSSEESLAEVLPHVGIPRRLYRLRPGGPKETAPEVGHVPVLT